MKKNININMFGQLYAIDEDAYSMLQHYLDSIKACFADKEGGEEILDDIEHRVAELLWQQKQNGRIAVDIELVKGIIEKIGQPNEIDQENTSDAADSTSDGATDGHDGDDIQEEEMSTTSRRGLMAWMRGRYLYRDPADKVLGGVCSGMAKFTGMGNSLWWRLGVIVMIVALYMFGKLTHIQLFWTLPIVYLIMWFIIPLAETPIDTLRMKGRDVTVETIKDEIINTIHDDGTTKKKHSSTGTGCIVSLLMMVLLAPFIFIIALILMVVLLAFTTLFGMSAMLFPVINDSLGGYYMEVLYDNPLTFLSCSVSVLLLVVIPILWVIRRVHSNGSTNSKGSSIWWLVAWTVALSIGMFSLISIVMYMGKAENDYYNNLNTQPVPAPTAVAPLPTDSAEVDTVGWQSNDSNETEK